MTQQDRQSIRRYPQRRWDPSSRLRDYSMLASKLLEEPLTYAKASSHTCWAQAMEKEINSILKNDTWEIVGRPTRKTPITTK